ncbi:zinc finger protein 774-like [Ischnura elegans]|uniref:zinc finger protein 774-like n=1 Tax=Ischnura elegans TaxID=197161 RepID=UPI001ED88E9E|nr:zinc finger protein 774-like [Ischnura elegans]
MLYTSDPAGISTDVSDPLATDELTNPVSYKCPSVKEDHISDDEDRYRLNDCTHGASSKLIHQDISGQPITLTASQGEKVKTQGTGAMVEDLEWSLIGAKKEPSLEENTQLTLGEDGDPIERSTIAHDSTTKAFGVQTTDGMPIQTTSTSYLPAEGNVRSYTNEECTVPTALVTQSDFNAGASLVKTERNLMDEDMEKCGAPATDMKKNRSIPDDRQCNGRNNKSHKLSGTGGAKTFFGEKGGFDAPNTMNSLRNIRIIRIERNGCETLVGDKEEVPNCSIKNPRSSNRLNKNSFHCRHAFNDKNELIKHTKSNSDAHNFDAVAESSIAEKSYLCSVCKKSFSLCNDLVSHIRSHTGEKSFSCSECEKSFSNKSNLVAHIRTHTGEKPFSCTICSKSFTEKVNLNSHIHAHTGERPHSCNYCEKTFSKKSYLVTHIRTHTGEKPYSCTICFKSFTQSGNLNAHIRSHAGERPYTCNLCEKSFSSKSHLVRHVRTHSVKIPFS